MGSGLSIRYVLMRVFFASAAVSGVVAAQEAPVSKPVPMPYEQASFQREGVEITRYHFGAGLHRPFLFPVIGPSDGELADAEEAAKGW